MRISWPPMSKLLLYVSGFIKIPVRYLTTLLMAMGCVLVFNHLGAIITGSFSTRSRMISKETLPEPTIIPVQRMVRPYFPADSTFSTCIYIYVVKQDAQTTNHQFSDETPMINLNK